MIRMTTIAISLLCVSGCTTIGGKSGPVKTANTSAEPVALSLADERIAQDGFGALDDAALPEKACGMVLWTLEGNRPEAIFRYVSGKEAEVNIGGTLVKLSRMDYSGASGYGVYESQLFQSTDGVAVEVNAKFGLGFNGGSYLEQGVVKITDSHGWSLVSPTAGIAGCRS
ncbi:hypothetical protein [Hyphococcus sp. DH-69]|uniref:hypothetical protein n=1 Tax=Hyphococcus formosus TaxID=3143534 RepID=UPI00398BA995